MILRQGEKSSAFTVTGHCCAVGCFAALRANEVHVLFPLNGFGCEIILMIKDGKKDVAHEDF